MKRMTLKAEYDWNLLYDPKSIKFASSYLSVNNHAVARSSTEWEEYITTFLMKHVAKLAKLYHTDSDWETKWSTFSGTGGFVLIFTIADVTSKGYPVIEADCYVTPNLGNHGTIETKFRKEAK